MKKSILLISVFFLAGLAFAVEQAAPSATQRAWQSSLSEIKEATDVVVLTNQMLESEFDSLNTQVATLEKMLADQQASNQQLRDAVLSAQSATTVSSNTTVAENELEFTRKALDQKKQELAAVQAKREAARKRQALRRLDLKELELEKQAGIIDQSAKGDARVEDLRLEIRALKEEFDSLRGQEKYIQERMLVAGETKNKNDSDVEQEIAKLELRKKQLLASRDTNVARLPGIEDMLTQTKRMDRQSDMLEEQLTTLRENIALLEYRINMLGQFRNRTAEKQE